MQFNSFLLARQTDKQNNSSDSLPDNPTIESVQPCPSNATMAGT